ncbi:MAG: ATP-binding protein, partial [bacterium]
IPEKIRYRIFEPFFTTKTHKLGLGLNICKSILERYKGRLRYHNHRNQSGQATAFTITLPVNFDCQSCHSQG